MKEYHIDTSEIKSKAALLAAGDRVYLSGTVYTARDAAHKRINELMDDKKPLPFEISGAVIYYCGPTPARPGTVIGSCGPTTSGRMDKFTPRFLDAGLAAMIGKGQRSAAVNEAIKRNGAVYFCAEGGAGALASQCIKSCDVIAFEDLGCESVKRIVLEELPVTVGTDSYGNSLFSVS
jgi:fumarate hydratase subunit beta